MSNFCFLVDFFWHLAFLNRLVPFLSTFHFVWIFLLSFTSFSVNTSFRSYPFSYSRIFCLLICHFIIITVLICSCRLMAVHIYFCKILIDLVRFVIFVLSVSHLSSPLLIASGRCIITRCVSIFLKFSWHLVQLTELFSSQSVCHITELQWLHRVLYADAKIIASFWSEKSNIPISLYLIVLLRQFIAV